MSLDFNEEDEAFEFTTVDSWRSRTRECQTVCMADLEKPRAKDHLTNLPAELQLTVLEHLDARALAMVSSINWHFHDTMKKWQSNLANKIYSKQRERLQRVTKACNYDFAWKPANLDDPAQHLLDCLIDFDKKYHILEKTKNQLELISYFCEYFMIACRFDAASTREDVEIAWSKTGPLTAYEEFLKSLNEPAIRQRDLHLLTITNALTCDLIRWQMHLDGHSTEDKPFFDQCPYHAAEEAWNNRLASCPTWTKPFSEVQEVVTKTRPFQHSPCPAPLLRMEWIDSISAPFTALPAFSLDERSGADFTNMAYVASESNLLAHNTAPRCGYGANVLQQAAVMEGADVWHSDILQACIRYYDERVLEVTRCIEPFLDICWRWI